jgi:hypothetical protein
MFWWLAVVGLSAIIVSAAVVCWQAVRRLDLGPAPATAGTARDVAAVNQVLNRLERAYAGHDAPGIAECIHECAIAILTAARPDGDAIILDKTALLREFSDVSANTPPRGRRRFTERDILVRQGESASEALVECVVKDRWPDGREEDSKELCLFIKQGRTWRLLLATPMFWEEKVLVLGILPRSQGEMAGLRAGDVVTGYDGIKIRRVGQLIPAVQKHFDDVPDTVIPLRVMRGAENRQFDLKPGLIGCAVETRLFPAAGAELIGSRTPHPVKETVARLNDAVPQLNADRMLPELYPRGALVFLFTRDGVLCADPSQPRAGLRQILEAASPACDWSTYRCDTVRALVQGPIALVTCRSRVTLAGGEESTPFVNAYLFARQSGRWYGVAPLMDRVDIGDEDISGPTR